MAVRISDVLRGVLAYGVLIEWESRYNILANVARVVTYVAKLLRVIGGR